MSVFLLKNSINIFYLGIHITHSDLITKFWQNSSKRNNYKSYLSLGFLTETLVYNLQSRIKIFLIDPFFYNYEFNSI